MDRAIYPIPPAPALAQTPPALRPPDDSVVPVLREIDQSAPLPPDRHFVAQAVAAKLSAPDDSAPAGDIMPDERRLRPYGVPMLPADPPEPP